MWIDFSEWAQRFKISVFQVNAHQKVISAEDFNHQAGRMTHSGNASQPLSQTCLTLPSGLMNNVPVVVGEGSSVRTQKHRLPLTKAKLSMASAECPPCQRQMIGHHSPR